MFKKVLNNFGNVKIKLIILLVVFAVLISVSIKNFFITFINDSDSTIKYKETSTSNYIVKLKPNNFYDSSILPEGMSYIANLIDEIDLTFNYLFSVTEIVNYNVEYSVDAITRVYSEDGKTVLYEKIERIVDPVKVNNINIADYSFKKDVVIDYDYYNDFVKKFKSSYGLTSTSDLSIILNVTGTGVSDNFQNPIKINSKSIVKVPLSERTVNISFNADNIFNDGTITEKRFFNGKSVVSLVIFLITSFASIISVIFIIKYALSLVKGKTPYDLELNKILKENDSIIANIKTDINLSNFQIVNIQSFEELRDVHDNIGFPILFYELITGRESHFYIIKDNMVYYYVLKIDNLELNGGVNNGQRNN